MATKNANAIELLRKQSGLSAKVCEKALKEHHGDIEAALEALARSGKLDPMRMDPRTVPETLLGEAAIEYAFRGMKELGAGPAIIKQVRQQISADGADAIQQAGRMARMSAAARQKEKRLRGKKLKDKVFGTLEWNVWWEGKARLPSLGKNVALSVESDEGEPPTKEQQQAYQSLQAMDDSLREAVEQASYRYYRKVRPNYLEQFDEDESPGKMPQLSEAADIWRLSSRPTVHIPAAQGKGWRAELGFNCSWDEEHGHEVVLRNGKVVHVSVQGEGWE